MGYVNYSSAYLIHFAPIRFFGNKYSRFWIFMNAAESYSLTRNNISNIAIIYFGTQSFSLKTPTYSNLSSFWNKLVLWYKLKWKVAIKITHKKQFSRSNCICKCFFLLQERTEKIVLVFQNRINARLKAASIKKIANCLSIEKYSLCLY